MLETALESTTHLLHLPIAHDAERLQKNIHQPKHLVCLNASNVQALQGFPLKSHEVLS
jgi:hypothetical protein